MVMAPAWEGANNQTEMPPKKKLTKKDRARIEAEKAEELRVQKEIERQNVLQIQRERMEKERIETEQREQREMAEQEVREMQLQETRERIKQMAACNRECFLIERGDNEWIQFLQCNGLPNPMSCKEMNTYVYLWRDSFPDITVDDAEKRTDIVLQMISELENLIESPLGATKSQVSDWQAIRIEFQEVLADTLDIATYHLLRDIENNLIAEDLRISSFNKVSTNFTLCLWTPLCMPAILPNPRAPPPPRVSISFPDVKISVHFPANIDCQEMAVRILWVHFDHLSQNCATYPAPPCPKELQLDLYEYTSKEWKFKMNEKALQVANDAENIDQIEREVLSSQIHLEDSTITQIITETLVEDLIEDMTMTKTTEPTVDQKLLDNEEKMYQKIKSRFESRPVAPNEINLRKYYIVGGVIHMNLLHQPPQPKSLLSRTIVTSLLLPKKLSPVHFHFAYVPPPPPEAGVRRLPEEIEAEIKKMEAEFEKLVLFNIDLPETVLWFEPPLVCQWNEEEKVWLTTDIHDVKYNEDKFTMSFRAGRMGIFGVASNKYANMPYQTWDLKPESKGQGIVFSITASIIIVEFTINGSDVVMTQLQNAATMALQDQIGVKYRLSNLIKLLQSAGINVFPSYDVFSYTEGTCEKLWPLERHLYNCMAFLSAAFNFSWSRWNNLAGRRIIVLQMREFQEKRKQVPYSMLRVTPQEAALIDCTEVSQSFNPTKLHRKFFSDLLHLTEGTCTITAKKKLKSANLRTVQTVAEILLATRVLSFA